MPSVAQGIVGETDFKQVIKIYKILLFTNGVKSSCFINVDQVKV